MPTRRRITAAHQLARRLAATVMLRQWAIEEQLCDTPNHRITRLLDAVEATGLRLHIPGPGRGHALADRLDQALAELDVHIAQAEHAAAIGAGQADVRTRQRGGDQVTARINWNTIPPHIADAEAQRLRKLRESISNQVAYDLAKLQRALSESVNKDTRSVSAGQSDA